MLTSNVFGQSPAGKRKPPNGIPADAELFNGKWYKRYDERLQWNTARQKCETLGGQLAVVPDEPTWAFLRKHIQNAVLWLGATDENSPGTWKWIDGTPLTFTAWRRGEPNNWGGKEHCLATVDGAWYDRQGDNKLPKSNRDSVTGFICEWKDKGK